MRPSPLLHPVALLRKIICLGQKELAALVGKSTRTIQAVELKQLPLSEILAKTLSLETGVSLHWLLDGDPSKPPTADYAIYQEDGRAYTLETYDLARARRENVTTDIWQRRPGTLLVPAGIAMIELVHLLARLAFPLFTAVKTGHEDLAIYKLNKFAKQFNEEFGYVISEEVLKFLKLTRKLVAEPSVEEEVFPDFIKKHGKVLISPKIPKDEWEDAGLSGNTIEEKLKSLKEALAAFIEEVPAIDVVKRTAKPKIKKSRR